MNYPKDSIFVTGVAKVAKEDAINAMYGTFSLSLVIDLNTNEILDAGASMTLELSNRFLRDLMIGRSLVTDTDAIIEEVKRRFLALSQKAVIVALRDAQNHYLMIYPGAKRK